MFIFNTIITGGPGLFFLAILWAIVHYCIKGNLYTPWSHQFCLLSKQRKAFPIVPVNFIQTTNFLNSPTGASPSTASYHSGLQPIVKSNRPGCFSLQSGSAKRFGFLLGFFILLAWTSHSATIRSTGAGGNWSNPATWNPAQVPGKSDQVTIVAGSTVIIDTEVAGLTSLSISGTLQYEAENQRTLSAAMITVNSGGKFLCSQGGSVKTHQLIA